MYRVRKAKKPVYCLEIVLEFTDDAFNPAPVAASNLKHPANLKLKDRLEPGAFAVYDSFLDTIASRIIGSGLNLFKQYPSKKSYAYYFEFKNDDDVTFKFKFRIANHKISGQPGKSKAETASVVTSDYIIRNISIGDTEEFKSGIQAIQAVTEICKELKAGNLDIMLKRYHFTADDVTEE